ncbi:MAG: hypothetical protein M3R50_12750 [Bacteroidota bacterium]|nr:hypothetical protein [Bacteroidota bacterium]
MKFLSIILLLLLAGCTKRNFFPDEDDPGLSRFTSRGYNIATAYINNVPYINPFHKFIIGGSNSVPTLRKVITNSMADTLSLSWDIGINDNSQASYNGQYHSISLLMPIPKSFNQSNFLQLSGTRSDSNQIQINSSVNQPYTLAGTSNIYFVQLKIDKSITLPVHYIITGLFDGNIGDTILVTKGRFDFEIDASTLNF